MIQIDAILFDLDGTLVDSKRDLAISVRHLQEHYRANPSTDDEVGSFIGDGVVKLVQRALPKLRPSELEGAVLDFKKYYREHCLDNTHIYPGVKEALKHFKDKALAVVTNKPVKVSALIMNELGLSSYFRVLIGGDSLPQKKPHPEPIRNALKSMHIKSPKRAVTVGDSCNDIEAGRGAGTYTCGVHSNIGDIEMLSNSKPDFVVHRLSDLSSIFS